MVLVVNAINMFGILGLLYVYAAILPSALMPLDIILIILWIVALALPAKEILGKK